jgi:hypothetical protein
MITQGTPFFGYVSLTNAAPGPVNIAIFIEPGAAALGSLPTNTNGQPARLYITNVALSSNDTAQALITVDTGGTTPTKIQSEYLSSSQPPGIESIPEGVCRCIPGVFPRASASAVTSGKTVEVTLAGYLSFS